jgi:[protein-PII] uridylyltransferase
VPRRKSLLARLWTGRKSPISDRDFTVVDGRIDLRKAGSVEDPQKVLRLFEWIARHDLRLSTEAEITVESAIPKLRKWLSATPDLWEYLRGLRLLPYAAAALRAMHRLGLLNDFSRIPADRFSSHSRLLPSVWWTSTPGHH